MSEGHLQAEHYSPREKNYGIPELEGLGYETLQILFI